MMEPVTFIYLFIFQSGPVDANASPNTPAKSHQPLLVPEKGNQEVMEGGGGLRQTEEEDAPFIVTIHGIPSATTNMYNMMVG